MDGWFRHPGPRPARRRRPAAGASAGSTTWSISGGVNVPAAAVAAPAARAPARSRRPRSSACPTRSGASAVVAVSSVGDADRSTTRARLGRGRRTRAPGRRAASCAVDDAAAAGQRQGRPARPVARSWPRGRADDGTSSRSRCAPGSAASPCARACCCAGDAGWGEFSPFLEYDAAGRRALAALPPREAADDGWPAPRARPRCRSTSPCPAVDRRAGRARSCSRAAAAAPPRSRSPSPARRSADDQARLEAVRDALGPDGPDPHRRQRRLGRRRGGRRDPRCSTGPPAAWSTSSSRAPSVEDLAAVRRRVDVPIAADESIRRAEDPYRVRDLEAADIAVLKVQPLGGVRACLRIAEDIGLPVVVVAAPWRPASGIAAGVALAAALPELPYACGLATGAAAHRRRRSPSRCCRSTARCPSYARSVDAAALDRGRRAAGPRGALARTGWRRYGSRGPVSTRRTPSTALARGCVDELVRVRRPRRRAGARLAQRAAGVRGVRRGRGRAAPAAHPHRRALGRLPRPRAGQGPAARPVGGRAPPGHRGRPTCTRPCSRPRTPAYRWSRSPPTGRPGCAAPTPTRPPTRSASSAPPSATADLRRAPRQRRGRAAAGRRLARARAAAPPRTAGSADDPARCTSTSSSRSRWSPTTGDGWGVRSTAAPTAGLDGAGTAARRSRRRSARAAHGRGGRRRRRAAGAGARRARPAGRCWPSRPAARAPATHAIRTYRLLLGDPDSAGRIERVVVFGHPTLSRPVARLLARDDVEVYAVRGPSGWTDPGHHVHAGRPVEPRRRRLVAATADDRREPDRGSRSGATRDARARPRRLDALLAGRARPDAVRRGRGGQRRRCRPGGLLVRRGLQPDPRPRPDGRARYRGRRPPDGARQPRPGRHRRRRSRRAIGAALGRPHSTRSLALLGDVTFLHDAQRPGARARRAAARPDDRGGQRRRRLDLRHRSSRAPSSTRTSLRPALRHPARRRPRQPLRRHPDAALAGRLGRRARARAGQPRPAASRSSRPSYAATTGASSTPRSAPW